MSAVGEWVEYAHFDGRMLIERSDYSASVSSRPVSSPRRIPDVG